MTVQIKMLLATVHFCGTRGTCGDVFESCVTDRKQKGGIKESNDANHFFLRLGKNKT